jgi:Protein of unknown function (DUF3830)
MTEAKTTSPGIYGRGGRTEFSPTRAMRMTFEDDVVCVARLVADAPITCDGIWELLSARAIESLALHGIWAGHELAAEIPTPSSKIPPENQSLYPAPGEILYWTIIGGVSRNYPDDIHEFALIYGPDTRLTLGTIGDAPGNVFASVVINLDGFMEVCHRMRYEGAKQVRFEAMQWRAEEEE